MNSLVHFAEVSLAELRFAKLAELGQLIGLIPDMAVALSPSRKRMSESSR